MLLKTRFGAKLKTASQKAPRWCLPRPPARTCQLAGLIAMLLALHSHRLYRVRSQPTPTRSHSPGGALGAGSRSIDVHARYATQPAVLLEIVACCRNVRLALGLTELRSHRTGGPSTRFEPLTRLLSPPILSVWRHSVGSKVTHRQWRSS